MRSIAPLGRLAVRFTAVLAVLAAPLVSGALGLEAWRLICALDLRTATVADVVVAAASGAGAVAAAALTFSAAAMIAAPRRSRARRVATEASPLIWRRIVTIAMTGTAAAGLAIPATAAPPVPSAADQPASVADVAPAGWVDPGDAQDWAPGWVTAPSAGAAADGEKDADAAPAPRVPAADVDAGAGVDAHASADEHVPSRATEGASGVAVPAEDSTGASHVVHDGDSLWSITAEHTGASDAAVAQAWGELYALNRDVVGDDPGLIHPGDELALPAGWQR